MYLRAWCTLTNLLQPHRHVSPYVCTYGFDTQRTRKPPSNEGEYQKSRLLSRTRKPIFLPAQPLCLLLLCHVKISSPYLSSFFHVLPWGKFDTIPYHSILEKSIQRIDWLIDWYHLFISISIIIMFLVQNPECLKTLRVIHMIPFLPDTDPCCCFFLVRYFLSSSHLFIYFLLWMWIRFSFSIYLAYSLVLGLGRFYIT